MVKCVSVGRSCLLRVKEKQPPPGLLGLARRAMSMKKLKKGLAVALCGSMVLNAVAPVLGSEIPGEPATQEAAKSRGEKTATDTGAQKDLEQQTEESKSSAENADVEVKEEDPETNEVEADTNGQETALETDAEQTEEQLRVASDSNAEKHTTERRATASNALLAEEEQVTMKLTFDANGSVLTTGERTQTNEVTIPSEILLPEVEEPEGLKMTGWYTAPEGGN